MSGCAAEVLIGGIAVSTGEDHMASDKDLEALCARQLRGTRWPEQVRCPHCYSEEVTDLRQYMGVFQRYLCLACGRTFNDKTGTIFENSKVSLSAWARAAYLLAADQPITAIAENVGVSYPTALRITKELRKSSLSHVLQEIVKGKPFGLSEQMELESAEREGVS
jgi:transposase-like protein